MRPGCLVVMLMGIWLTCAAPAWAELCFVQPVADLGEVRGGPVVAQRFECVNVGPAPVEIVEVRRACGCLMPTFDRRPIAPGERTAIAFQVRTLGQPNGPRQWRATVRWRQGNAIEETGLTIAATVVNEVTVEPAVLALYVGTALRQEVRVKDARSPGLKVVTAQATCPAVRVTTRTEGDGTTVVVLDVAGDALGHGRQDATLNLYTDDPFYRHLQVPITLARAGTAAVTAVPAVARLRLSASQPVGSALVRLRPAGDTKVEVAGVEVGDGVTATWATGPGTAATLRVQADLRRLADRVGPHAVRVRLAAGSDMVIPVEIEIEE